MGCPVFINLTVLCNCSITIIFTKKQQIKKYKMLKDFEIKVPGTNTTLKSNSIYYIREVTDSQAPDGYQKKDIHYHPIQGIGKNVNVPFHELTSSWNTGFYRESYCYNRMNEKEVESILDTLKKELLPRLKYATSGDITDGREDNHAIFDRFKPFNIGSADIVESYKLYNGNMVDTSKPLHFLMLWWALLGEQLVSKEEYELGMRGSTNYILVDQKVTNSKEVDMEYEKMYAVSTVMGVISGNSKPKKNFLSLVFKYVGLDIELKDTDEKTLISLFSKWCQKNGAHVGYRNENAVEFNEIYAKFNKDEGVEELIVYKKLVEDIKDKKIILERKDIMLDGESLGANKKEAASRIVKDQEMYQKFMSI